MGSQPVRVSYGNTISAPSSLNENFCSSGLPLLPVFVPVKQSSFSFTEWNTMCRPSGGTFQIPHWFPLPESCLVILVGVTFNICIICCFLPWWMWANSCLDKMWKTSMEWHGYLIQWHEYFNQTITLALKIFCSVHLNMGHLQPRRLSPVKKSFSTEYGARFDKEGMFWLQMLLSFAVLSSQDTSQVRHRDKFHLLSARNWNVVPVYFIIAVCCPHS